MSPRPARTARSSGSAISARERHQAWLDLVDTEGPFLAVSVMQKIEPQGFTPMSVRAKGALVGAKPAFERAWDVWDAAEDKAAAAAPYAAARDAWLDVVFRDVLGWGDRWVAADPLVATAQVTSPDGRVSVAPTGVVRAGDRVGALVWVVDPVGSLRDAGEDGWSDSPIDRMELMLRQAELPIGIVTDGRWWALVSAPKGTLAASGIVDAQTWVEEPAVRDAFAALVSIRRLLGGNAEDRLPALFARSVVAAEEITEALGGQVRKAVELVVAAFDESSREARRRGEPDPLPSDGGQVYEAAVTAMMRVVFLLFAEERGMLPAGELFALGYGLSDQLDVLRARERDENAEALDSTYLTWHRLLATSQALFQGATFEDMRLPAYGGSLFDPSRFDFLTATTERGTLALRVSDRVMLHVLEAVQEATVQKQQRRISFRDIDVEQIGYIYEGLLGYTCRRADEVLLGLIGKDGAEPEMPLRVLEDLYEDAGSDSGAATAIVAWCKKNQPASEVKTAGQYAKALAAGDAVPDAEQALRAVTDNANMREQLRSWLGVIRRDLRNRPVVIEKGGWVVVETPSRKNAGAHYTPRALAEEVVEHALKPILFDPGPYQTPDESQWRPKSSTEILDLKVADIACGSGAFLVAAARYLGRALAEAWRREGVERHLTPQEAELKARREVVAQCLYGADINGMAVEMCKLSLWLVSLDPKLPFSFVHDKVLHGNSLLGLTSLRQLEDLHIARKPRPLAQTHAQQQMEFSGNELVTRLDVEHRIERAVRLRRALASPISEGEPARTGTAKRAQLRQFEEAIAEMRMVADGVIAAGLALGGKPGKKLDEAYENLRIAVDMALPRDGGEGDSAMLTGILDRGLTPAVETDEDRWRPLHWCLEVPDVMEQGGFDAIIGNPPFLGGQKLTGAMGTEVRDWFVNQLAGGSRGSADLVAYFFLRAAELLTPRGTLGLIATNTIAQGDTREVGLDRMVDAGFTITRAVQSRSWPAASANLEFAGVWGSVGPVSEEFRRDSDGAEVARISTLLEPEGRVSGRPVRLVENAGIAFQGCIVLGKGFIVEPDEAAPWIAADPRNAEVLFPYLNGEDLNSRPDASASRWVIDFFGRDEKSAAAFHQPYERVLSRVKQDRMGKPKAVASSPWWRFLRERPAMRKAIADLDEVLVIALVSKSVMPYRVPTGQVFSHKLGVFATDSYGSQAVLSSSPHALWAIANSSTMRKDINYSPSDVFLTFPLPTVGPELNNVGHLLDVERRAIMQRQGLGLTELYNRVNDPELPDSANPDIARLRQIHVEIDQAVMAAYGWDDVELNHGFHTYRQMTRWTVCPEARVETLDRLLEENHRRAALQGDAPAPADDEPVEGDED